LKQVLEELSDLREAQRREISSVRQAWVESGGEPEHENGALHEQLAKPRQSLAGLERAWEALKRQFAQPDSSRAIGQRAAQF
jgi:transposase